jgi:hypothetical protein
VRIVAAQRADSAPPASISDRPIMRGPQARRLSLYVARCLPRARVLGARNASPRLVNRQCLRNRFI